MKAESEQWNCVFDLFIDMVILCELQMSTVSNKIKPFSVLSNYQGLDNVHKQRVAEVLNDPESIEKRRSRESLNVDVVKYESGPDGGEEVSMSVEWNGVSTVHS